MAYTLLHVYEYMYNTGVYHTHVLHVYNMCITHVSARHVIHLISTHVIHLNTTCITGVAQLVMYSVSYYK